MEVFRSPVCVSGFRQNRFNTTLQLLAGKFCLEKNANKANLNSIIKIHFPLTLRNNVAWAHYQCSKADEFKGKTSTARCHLTAGYVVLLSLARHSFSPV